MTECRKLIDFLFPFLLGGCISVIAVLLGQGGVYQKLSDGFSLAGVLLLAKRCFTFLGRLGCFNGIRYVLEIVEERLLPLIRGRKRREGEERLAVSAFRAYGELLAGIVYLALGGGFLFFV